MALQAPVTLRASVGQSAIMTGARTCVNTLNPAVNQCALPFGMTRMGLNPSDDRKYEASRGERTVDSLNWICRLSVHFD